jgi:hypothetical protein
VVAYLALRADACSDDVLERGPEGLIAYVLCMGQPSAGYAKSKTPAMPRGLIAASRSGVVGWELLQWTR